MVLVLWIPLLALVLGVVLGCATAGGGATAAPSRAELQRLVAAELAADARFDSFGTSANAAAHRLAASFRPVLVDVAPVACRAIDGASADCTLEVVLRYPDLDGRETRTLWERRLTRGATGWRLLGQALD